MEVEPEDAYKKIEHENYVFYFCSRKCEEKFNENPEKYVSKIKLEEPIAHGHHHN
jgi:Cu+-exporting ATPase